MSLIYPIHLQHPRPVTQRSGGQLVANLTSHSPYQLPQPIQGDVSTVTCGDNDHYAVAFRSRFATHGHPEFQSCCGMRANECDKLIPSTHPLPIVTVPGLLQSNTGVRRCVKPKKRHKGGDEEDSPGSSPSSRSSGSSDRYSHNPYCFDNPLTYPDTNQSHDGSSDGSSEDAENANTSDPECDQVYRPGGNGVHDEKSVDATVVRQRGLSVVPPCGHPSDWKRLRFKKGLSHFVCTQCGLKWKSKGIIDNTAAVAPEGQ
jgi:hypothetical protein